MLQVAGRAIDWAQSKPNPSKGTTWQAQYFREVVANAGYASLVSCLTAAVVVGALAAEGCGVFTLLCAIALGLAIHLVVLLFMVLIRVFRLIRDPLAKAETGGWP
jgi:hypothetical protein